MGSFFSHISLFLLIFLGFLNSPARAIERPAEQLQEVGVFTELGAKLDLDIELINAEGELVTISSLLDLNRPSIMVPVYYGCPRLCGLTLDGVQQLIDSINLRLGQDYQVLVVSFDSSETYHMAKSAQKRFRKEFGRDDGDPKGWRFFVGADSQIERLMAQLGFNYLKDKEEFAHSAAVMILTPQGKVSQYFTGVTFSPRDVRLSLVEASQGRIGSLLDQALLYCFRFDQTKGRYSLAAYNFIRAGGALTLLALGGIIVIYARKR
jgi:protein SCO1/2